MGGGAKLRNSQLERLNVADFKKAEKNKLVVILDNLRSLHNVGSAFRTADAFLVSEIALCGVTGTPPHREIEKTALGATASVEWKYFKTTLEATSYYRTNGYNLFAVEQTENSISLENFDRREALALIFGNEVYGIEQEVIDVCDGTVEIPQSGTKHSLNVSVAVGVVLWELTKKESQPGN